MEKISIIIPVWKEKSIKLQPVFFDDMAGVEVVVALAEGDEVTEAPASDKTVRSSKGRASQMNAGAEVATGDILLFLHADTSITSESLQKAREALNSPGVAGGAYRLKIDSSNPWLKLVAFVANLRSRIFGLPFGDQAIFLKRETFNEIGGYEKLPILEDVRLVHSIKEIGRLTIIDDYAVTSPRSWHKRGMIKNTIRNWAIMIAYTLEAEPEKLAGWFNR